MRFSFRSLLLAIALVGVLVKSGMVLSDVAAFTSKKEDFRNSLDVRHKLRHGDPQGCALEYALTRFGFFRRHTPILAFVGADRAGSRQQYLWIDWLANRDQIDGARIVFADQTSIVVNLDSDQTSGKWPMHHAVFKADVLGVPSFEFVTGVLLRENNCDVGQPKSPESVGLGCMRRGR